MIKGFKDFLMRGNVIDLAVAVVIGAAFATVVKAFTDGVIQPLLASAGSSKSGHLGFSLRHSSALLEETTRIDVGMLISAGINFVIVAAVVYFVLVMPMAKLNERRAKGLVPEPEGVPIDTQLLTEIRDLLAAERRVG